MTLATMSKGNYPLDDPLSLALRPPSNETPAARTERLRKEAEAKKLSDEIDKMLREEAIKSKKENAGEYKILLLGQAEAGKTTILKQMRLLYQPKTHEKDRRSWKAIILLNVITSIRILLDSLDAVDAFGSSHASVILDSDRGSLGPTSSRTLLDRLKVAPILSMEATLRRQLGAVGEKDDLAGRSNSSRPWIPHSEPGSPKSRFDVAILLKVGWQERLLEKARSSLNSRDDHSDCRSMAESTRGSIRSFKLGFLDRKRSSPNLATSADMDGKDEFLPRNSGLHPKEEDPGQLLITFKEEVNSLWNDPVAKKLKKRGKLDTADATAYFLDNYERIVSPTYEPNDDDILHARVRTVGIAEERFKVDRHLTYRIYDVGGSRSQRPCWAPYFDDAQAIIFLAPISAFDQTLVEDPSVNRVKDSLSLFAQIIENPMLKDAGLILFLNKIDILERKLRQGIQLSDYFPEYNGDNDFEAVWRWFRSEFRTIVRSNRSVSPTRPIYVHTTVATSTKQIRAILLSVNDTILRDNLRATGLVV